MIIGSEAFHLEGSVMLMLIRSGSPLTTWFNQERCNVRFLFFFSFLKLICSWLVCPVWSRGGGASVSPDDICEPESAASSARREKVSVFCLHTFTAESTGPSAARLLKLWLGARSGPPCHRRVDFLKSRGRSQICRLSRSLCICSYCIYMWIWRTAAALICCSVPTFNSEVLKVRSGDLQGSLRGFQGSSVKWGIVWFHYNLIWQKFLYKNVIILTLF